MIVTEHGAAYVRFNDCNSSYVKWYVHCFSLFKLILKARHIVNYVMFKLCKPTVSVKDLDTFWTEYMLLKILKIFFAAEASA